MCKPLTIFLSVCLLSVSTTLTIADEQQLEIARVHFQKGRYAESLELYEKLKTEAAFQVVATLGISRVYVATGKYAEAETLLTELAKAKEKPAVLWARLAELQVIRGKYAEAEKNAEHAIKLDSDSLIARLARARVYTETGRITEADAEFVWFVRYYNRVQPEDAESLYYVAQGALMYARWHSASQIFGFIINTLCPDSLKADKTYWQSTMLSGALLLEKYNRGQALPEFRDALAINAQAAEVHVLTGEAAFEKHDLEKAEEHADRALKINPHLVPALWLKIDLQLESGDIEGARKLLATALEVNPNNQRTLARLAASELLESGVPDVDSRRFLLSHLGNIREWKSEKETAFTKIVVQVAKQNPKPGYFLTQLAETLERRRRYGFAEELYRKAVEVMPQLSEPKTKLGMLYMRIGKHQDAKTLLDSAFKADPYHVRVNNMRKVLRVLEGYEKITTEHFVIHVDSEKDRILGRYMAEYLEEIYPQLVKELGFAPPHKTHFEIYNDSKGQSGHQWFSTRMVGLPWIQTIGASTGVIVALTSPTESPKAFNWARVLKHEFVHVITLQQTEFNIPHWYTEALAVTYEGGNGPEIWNELLLERVPKNDLRTLKNLNDGFIRPKSAMDWQFAYCQSRLYAKYMIENYGVESIAKLLEAYKNSLSTEQAVQKVFGVKLATFEKGYREYLEKIVSDLQGGPAEVDLDFAEAEKAWEADRGNSDTMAAFAFALLEQGQNRRATTLAESVLEKQPKHALAGYVLAQFELKSGNTDKAIGYLQTALDEKSPSKRVLKSLVKLQLTATEFDAAAKLLELGQKFFPSDRTWLKGLAAIALKNNDRVKLKSTLTQLAEWDGDDFAIRKKLTELAFEDRNFDEVLKFGTMSLHVDVLDAEIHHMLGVAYRELKRYPESIAELETAVQLDDDEPDFQYQLALTQQAAGDIPQAKATLQQLLKDHPDYSQAKERLEKLP